jgi:capsular polysaccharide biosynthesis protein
MAFSGAIYDRDGTLVRRSLRFCGPSEKVHSTDPEFFSARQDSEAVPGVGYYMGNIMSHYGHFITEGLSALWLSGGLEFDYFVAHPFIWGAEIPAFARQAYALVGVDTERIRLIRNPARFEKLIIPDRLWLANASVNAEYRKTISTIKTRHLRAMPRLKLYLSRAEVPRRAVPNERAIEEAFRRAGFVVIHPQNHSFGSQLALHGQTAILAGLAGSALHNVIFCPRGTATISVGDRRATLTRNQPICSAFIKGATAVIPYQESPGGFDIPTLEAELEEVLKVFSC